MILVILVVSRYVVNLHLPICDQIRTYVNDIGFLVPHFSRLRLISIDSYLLH